MRKYLKYYFLYTFFITLAFSVGLQSCQSQKIVEDDASWAIKMANSEMKRHPQASDLDNKKSKKWRYTHGVILKSVAGVWKATSDEKYYDYIKDFYDEFISEDGTIKSYKMSDFNIDKINAGKPLFMLYEKTGEERFKTAIFTLREQMRQHPRTKEGGFWHKKRYPYQMWLDGLYMASPFLAQFAVTFNEPELLDDVANQFVWMENHARDEKTGLIYHGWDESRQQRWAHPETGLSPHFWGRAMGWYAMALVDALDFFPADHPRREELVAITQRLFAALAKFQDEKTGLWYQVVDLGEREGNYLEASASSMFAYAMLKAVRKNLIDPKYKAVGQKAYTGLLENLIRTDKDGMVNLTKCCAVAGLGGDPYRDASYEYYVGEVIRDNDAKAVGPFILASLEIESAQYE